MVNLTPDSDAASLALNLRARELILACMQAQSSTWDASVVSAHDDLAQAWRGLATLVAEAAHQEAVIPADFWCGEAPAWVLRGSPVLAVSQMLEQAAQHEAAAQQLRDAKCCV